MKLALQQLPQHVSKKLEAIYIVSGDDPLLVQETLDLIRAAAQSAGFSERIRINTDSASEWAGSLYTHAQSLSLFSSKRILELDLTQIKLNAVSSKILQEYAARPSSDTLLLIRANKLDSKTEQSNWYKALDKVGVIIPVWPITLDQLPSWISQRAKKMDLNMTKDAAELLAILVEGNLLAAAQELEKLRLLKTIQTIDVAVIEETVMDHAHFDIFSLVDSALAGNTKRCLRILQNLEAEDTEPTLILWALTREVRTMAEMAKQVSLGISLGSLFPKFRIWEKRQASVRAFLQRHRQESCWAFLIEAAEVDRMIKGAESGNVWDRLGKVFLGVCLT